MIRAGNLLPRGRCKSSVGAPKIAWSYDARFAINRLKRSSAYIAVFKMVVLTPDSEWEEETGEMLPLKGYRMDQGSRPTHKKEIIRLYEQGMEPPDIARETRHSLKSVDRYLKDYERVKMMLKRGSGVEEISAVIGRGKSVVVEYVEIAQEYHPELF